MDMPALKTFVVYAREDKSYLDAFFKHAKVLEKSELIKIWHDGEIPLGAHWEVEIKNHLNQADIVLLFVTVNSITSEFITNEEMATAFYNMNLGKSKVVPVIVDHCLWQSLPTISQLQGLPQDMRPVVAWPNQNEAWANVTAGIKDMADTINAAKRKEREAQIAREKKEAEDAAKLARIQEINNQKAREKEEQEKRKRELELKKQEQRDAQRIKNLPKTDGGGGKATATERGTNGSLPAYFIFTSIIFFLVIWIHYMIRVYLKNYETQFGFFSTTALVALFPAMIFGLGLAIVVKYQYEDKTTTLLFLGLTILLLFDFYKPSYSFYAFDNQWLSEKQSISSIKTETPTQTPETTKIPSAVSASIPQSEYGTLPARQLAAFFSKNSDINQEIIYLGTDRLFETGSSIATDSLKKVVAEIGLLMKKNMAYDLQIEVHTDNTGDDKANKLLSTNRANTVKTLLNIQGVPQARMNSSGLGSRYPASSNDTPEGRTKNRRMLLKFIKS